MTMSIDIKCAKCGMNLEVDGKGDEIEVVPCSNCLQNATFTHLSHIVGMKLSEIKEDIVKSLLQAIYTHMEKDK